MLQKKGQTQINVEPNRVKWIVKIAQEWNLTHPSS